MIGKDYNHLKQARYQFFFVLSGIFLLIAVWLEPNFFINAFKGISDITPLNPEKISTNPTSDKLGTQLIPDDWKNLYLLKIWFNYNILPFLLMTAVFLVNFFITVFKNKKFGNEKALIIIPFLIFSLTFIYLVDANISLDHPWMLRRWIFTIIPVVLFYSVLFLFYLRQKNILLFRLITIFIILGNLVLLFPSSGENQVEGDNFLTFSQNQGLLGQTYEISKMFGKNDLILVSRESSGSGWSLISEPLRNLYNKKAVYFFNQNDYKMLNLDEIEEIYLITTEEELFLYEKLSKEEIAEKELVNNLIKPSKNPLEKPEIIETKTKIKIYKIIR
jgi:hypothetical protein